MKRMIRVLFACLLGVLAVMLLSASLAETVDSGTCGENLTWVLDDQGVLTISGTGAMADYASVTHYDEDDDEYYTYTNPWNNKSSIVRIVIEEGVTSIGSYAFVSSQEYYNDSNSTVKYAALPSTLTEIGASAFYNCVWLEQIDFAEGLTRIGSSAFSQCRSLKDISLPDSLSTIGNMAFQKCTSLRSVSMPQTLDTIGTQAFYNCTALTAITVPEGIAAIPYNAFADCHALESVTLPGTLTSIGGNAFDKCLAVAEVRYGGRSAAQWAQIDFAGEGSNPMCIRCVSNNGYGYGIVNPATAILYVDNEPVESVHLTADDGSVSRYAFVRCANELTLTVDRGYSGDIGEGAFYSCTGLKEITFKCEGLSIGANAFYGVTANVTYCPVDSWQGKMQNYGGDLTWNAAPPEIVDSGT